MPDFLKMRLRELGLIAYAFVLIQSLPGLENYKPKIGEFYFWSGLWQSWNMFAPNPAFESHIVTATFDLPDGSQSVFYFPNRLYPYRYSGAVLEKFRKWESEFLALKQNSEYAKYALSYAARFTHHEDYKHAKLTHYLQAGNVGIQIRSLDDYKTREEIYVTNP